MTDKTNDSFSLQIQRRVCLVRQTDTAVVQWELQLLRQYSYVMAGVGGPGATLGYDGTSQHILGYQEKFCHILFFFYLFEGVKIGIFTNTHMH